MNKTTTIILLMFLTSKLLAQNNRLNTNNSIGWYSYFGTFKLSNKFGLLTEYQWRRNDLITSRQQNLLRVGVNYQLNPRVLFRAGYALIETYPYGEIPLAADGVIVDAMLGTGLGGVVRGVYVDAIDAINASDAPVLAVDIPSGLCADTGRVLGAAVRADLTVTFIGLKRGLFTLQAPDYTGAVQLSDLGVPPEVYAAVPAGCARLELE